MSGDNVALSVIKNVFSLQQKDEKNCDWWDHIFVPIIRVSVKSWKHVNKRTYATFSTNIWRSH